MTPSNPKKIFLAVPEKFSLDALYPPTGLLYLAAMVRDHGYPVNLVDAQITGEEFLLKEFLKEHYDYFGTTILSPLRNHSFNLIRKIKQAQPNCRIIAGGAHVSIMPEQTLKTVKEIDVIVIGEGEETLLEILAGKQLHEIAGIWYRDEERICKTRARRPMDPHKIPQPAWDLIDLKKYRAFEDVVLDGVTYANKPFLTIYSSRGCTGNCSFCSTWWIWKEWRHIPAQRFVDEIEVLYRQGISHFFIADDSMINDEEFVHDFARLLAERKISIHYKIACRADKITQTVAESLKKSGCYEVHIGFESGSQKILDSLGKNLSVQQNIQAARILRAAGLRVYALVIIGAVAETIGTINETVDFLNLIQPDVVASMGGLMLSPGTKDYHTAKKEGLLTDDFWLGEKPFMYYTGSFSLLQLYWIYQIAIIKRKKIWSRVTLPLQFIWLFPVVAFWKSVFFMWHQIKKVIK